MDMTSDRLRNAMEAGLQDMSLDAPLFEGEETPTLKRSQLETTTMVWIPKNSLRC